MLLEIGFLAAFGVWNSPFGKQDFQTPYLMVEIPVYSTENSEIYTKILNSARTNAISLNYMNPKTGLYDVGIGYRSGGFQIEMGHQSEHELGSRDVLSESFDYIKLSYKIKTP